MSPARTTAQARVGPRENRSSGRPAAGPARPLGEGGRRPLPSAARGESSIPWRTAPRAAVPPGADSSGHVVTRAALSSLRLSPVSEKPVPVPRPHRRGRPPAPGPPHPGRDASRTSARRVGARHHLPRDLRDRGPRPARSHAAELPRSPRLLAGPDWVVAGHHEPYESPSSNTLRRSGTGRARVRLPRRARIQYGAHRCTLRALRSGGVLNAVFTDRTSGVTSRSAGRSLMISGAGEDGRVSLPTQPDMAGRPRVIRPSWATSSWAPVPGRTEHWWRAAGIHGGGATPRGG
ncbi:DUF1684 domain-containing protein [Streptomyces sp. NRRL S-340]|uniref:DUF1684 domain-containing protein n=1 Tax=Streptomyces sp. NRRL S-340 TaxID=1463901 RepID=UPI003B637DB9